VPLCYEDPPSSGALRQGEILGDLWEHRPVRSGGASRGSDGSEIQSLLHPRVIVMTADCDLEQDFTVRFDDDRPGNYVDILERDYVNSALLPHALLCDVYEATEIRSRTPPGTEGWRRIQQNQNERYHHFGAADVNQGGELPDLYLDFKKTFALPVEDVYAGLGGKVVRLAVVPPVYLHDVIHRLYNFLSRVGLPD